MAEAVACGDQAGLRCIVSSIASVDWGEWQGVNQANRERLMSSTSRGLLPHRIEYALVLVIVGALAALVNSAVQSARDPRGPNGLPIPAEHPDETRRVGHSSGLSIVLPVNWEFVTALPSESPKDIHLSSWHRTYPFAIGRVAS
ncbi:MAG: hypothetical protein JWN70_4421 [Planctomycetaceae bacterium]|nr:hypothetical protein [Planctomycetaceae bacterium]